MKPKAQPTLIQTIQNHIEKEKKLIRRKKFLLKFKIFLCIILPIVLILLTVKVVKIWLKLKLKNAMVPGLKKHPEPKHLKKAPVPQQIIEPEPAGVIYEPVKIVDDPM